MEQHAASDALHSVPTSRLQLDAVINNFDTVLGGGTSHLPAGSGRRGAAEWCFPSVCGSILPVAAGSRERAVAGPRLLVGHV
jgi:hypothetical protein